MVELGCLVQRRRRAAEIDAAYQRAALADFADDIRSGFFQLDPLADRQAVVAHDLIGRLTGHSLRTLDALHLAIALSTGRRCWRARIEQWRELPGRSLSAR